MSATVVRYDLYRGHPNMKLLPMSEMKQIMSDLVHDEENSWTNYLNYGMDEGDERFRLALRTFLDRRTENDDRGSDSSSPRMTDERRDLFITDGVSHGIELICRTCTVPGDEVWVERPTYFLAPKIFESNGMIVKSLPMTHDDDDDDVGGRVDIDRLVQLVEVDGIAPPKLVYIIPSYHNPTGRSMTVDDCQRLASFAIRNGVILVADEVYHLLDWELKSSNGVVVRRPAGFATYTDEKKGNSSVSDADRLGCCVSVSSFTKIWGPGIRLGWIDAPSVIMKRLTDYGYIISQGGHSPFTGRMMTHAIESNLLDKYLDKLRHEYAERYELMCDILKDEPRIAILTDNVPNNRRGGYFIWVKFPLNANSEEFSLYSIDKYGVRFMPGGRCDPFKSSDDCGKYIQSCARLCFANIDCKDLAPATSAFVEAFRSFMKRT